MSRILASVVLTLALALTGTPVQAAAPPGTAADAAQRPAAPALTVSPAVPMTGERVRVRTSTGTAAVRPALLQRARGASWITVTSGRTNRTGVAAFHYQVRRAVSLRVVAPAHRVGGRRLARVATRSRAVRPTAQHVTLQLDAGVGDLVDLRVVASHARPGRRVALQVAGPAGAWRDVLLDRMGGSRTLDLAGAVPRDQLVGRRVRVRLAPFAGAPAVASSPLSPPRAGAIEVTFDGAAALLTADPLGSVDAVRFFVDGVLLEEDTTTPWTADWTPAPGRHDVMARARGPLGSDLSPARTVEVPSGPLGADTGVAEGFALEQVQSGLDLPTSAASAPSGMVLVAEKAGVVKVVEPAEGGWGLPREVLDLRDQVHDEGDAGMIGLAVDPGFVDNGYVYLSYVRDDPDAGSSGGPAPRRSQQVVRYTWDDDRLLPASRHVVLGSVTGAACAAQQNIRTADCVPLLGSAHTIGDLAFDDRGRLLVGIGDGALYQTQYGITDRYEALRAQDPEVLAGKVLRIDPVTGHGVPDNPLYTGDGSTNASRVVALGLRNPFRFTVDGDRLVVGDVGDGDWEELDVQHLDDSELPNYGWPCIEGRSPTGLGDVADPDGPWHACAAVREPGVSQDPAYVYPHSTGGGSVTAGVFLESESYPAGVRGRYVFGDYAQNFFRTATISPGGEITGVAELADSRAAGGPVKFFTGPDGLVWSLSIMTGELRRLRHTGAALADRCSVGSFRRTFHDLDGPDSAFDQEYTGDPAWAWLYPYAAVRLPAEAMAEPTCEGGIRLAPTTGSPWLDAGEHDARAHPGDRFGAAWSGRVDLEAGTYRFVVTGSEWVRLWVDNLPVHDFYANEFWGDARVHEVVLDKGQHLLRAELVHGDQTEAGAEVTWERVGGPPEVSLVAPGNGHVTRTGDVPWQVVVSDPDGDDPDALAASVELAVDFLHYAGAEYHAHPSVRLTGRLTGTLTVDELHAPGHGVYRLRASATDASGARSTSAPVYVCFPGGDVGPCAS